MTTTNWIMVGALLLAPLLAVRVQKVLESYREKRNRRKQIFQTLMASRAVRLSFEHVRALNMIDLEFYGQSVFGIKQKSKKDAEVIDAWRPYRRHLQQEVPDEDFKTWTNEKDNRFRDLLFAMSCALGYEFEKAELESGAYHPDAHFYQDLSTRSIIQNLDKVLRGKAAVNVIAWDGHREPPQSSEGDTRQAEGIEIPSTDSESGEDNPGADTGSGT